MPRSRKIFAVFIITILSLIGFSLIFFRLTKDRVSALESGVTPAVEAGAISATDAVTSASLPKLDFVRTKYEQGIPRYALLNTIIPNRPRVGISTYKVKAGDNLFVIAEKFGIKPETVLWGNYDVLKDNPQLLRPDQELVILPTDGVYYKWKTGDTLAGVASSFKVESDAILNWPGNRLDLADVAQGNLNIPDGTWLIVPGGRRELKDWGPPAITRSNPAAAAYYGSGYCGKVYEGAIGTGAFVWPTTGNFLSGYDYSAIHPGIDIAGAVGNAVFAADSGVVVFAGWSEFGYGYMIVLDHGNGWQTAYGHLSAVGVTCGQSVGIGTVIGAVGSTGNSSGPHLHFEMRSEIYGKVNPWDFVSPP
jgi:hypothetical protein